MTDLPAFRYHLLALQDAICGALEAEDGGARFREDAWGRAEGGGGLTRILAGGEVFEKAGVAFSHVQGAELPPAATAARPSLAGLAWEGLGLSLVVHPRNPHVPISHLNLRLFIAGHGSRAPDRGAGAGHDRPVWWFGGVTDLTPCYGYEEDAVHWHRTLRDAVAPFGPGLHPRFKKACDDYFNIRHRGEQRGIGGVFFDDFNEFDFERCFALVRAVGGAYLPAYLPIVARRKAAPHGERERSFQLLRRGRYAEFNLVWDRGTLFGLQSGGRTESILMSLPPLASWDYGWRADPGSPEALLHERFLKPRDWAGEENQ